MQTDDKSQGGASLLVTNSSLPCARRQNPDQKCSMSGAAATTSYVAARLSPMFGSFHVITLVPLGHHNPTSFGFSEQDLGTRACKSLKKHNQGADPSSWLIHVVDISKHQNRSTRVDLGKEATTKSFQQNPTCRETPVAQASGSRMERRVWSGALIPTLLLVVLLSC